MAHDFITNKILEDTADAIRFCENSSAQIAPKDFAARIRELKYPKPTWLYFTMPEGGTVSLTKNGTPAAVTLEYSLDNGSTWTTWVETENVRSLALAAGQTMHVRNTSETSTGFSTGNDNYYNFAFTADTYAGGNTNSLLCKNPNNAVLTDYCFFRLYFQCSRLKTPSELPSRIGATNCYRAMFQITGIEKSPIIQLDTLTGCPFMFSNSNNLTLIKIYSTNMTTNTTQNWTTNVNPTGDFYCPAELTIPTGANGIPTGWTRHDI